MDEVLKRFFDWLESHGGPKKVAPAVGKSPQVFHNYLNRSSAPNTETMKLLSEAFPDFDATYILTGRSMAAVEEQYKRELAEMQIKLDTLQSLYVDSIVSIRNGGSAGKKFDGMSFRPSPVKTNPIRRGVSRSTSVSVVKKTVLAHTSKSNLYGFRFCDN